MNKISEKLKLYLLAITPLAVFLSLYLGIYRQSDRFNIKTISKILQLIDANIDHNQVLDVVEKAKEMDIEIPETIINFDTHSDLYVYQNINMTHGSNIYNWLNEYFALNDTAEELYWVMPEKAATDKDVQFEFMDRDKVGYSNVMIGNSRKKESEVNPNINNTPYIQYFLIDKTSGYMTEIINSEDEKPLANPKYKKIKIITCTEKTLPNFKDKNILLSIDSDYITNSGYDTTARFINNINEKEIKAETSKLLKTINKKNIRPQIITLTLSPLYVPEEDQAQMLKFMQKFIHFSGKEDIIKEYNREIDSPKITNPKDKKYVYF